MISTDRPAHPVPAHPVIVPIKLSLSTSGQRRLPVGLPACASISAARGRNGPYPHNDIKVTFFPSGKIEAAPSGLASPSTSALASPSTAAAPFAAGDGRYQSVCLSFDDTYDLYNCRRPVAGIEPDDVAESCSMIWDIVHTPSMSQHYIFAWAKVVAGLATINQITPTGSYRIHMHSDLVITSHVPERGDFSIFKTLANHRDPKIASRLSEAVNEDDLIIPIAYFYKSTPSAHQLMSKLRQAQAWLDWLGPSQGWPPFTNVTCIKP